MCRILILADIWGISFHAVVVFGLDKNFLSKSVCSVHFIVDWDLSFLSRGKQGINAVWPWR